MKTYRLITYNIHKGVAAFKNLSVIDRIRIALKESDADFLLLQELVGERQHKASKVEKHLEILADTRWPYSAYGKNAVFPTRNHGNAILSSAEIKEFHNLDLTIYPIEKRGLLHTVVNIGPKQLHLCSVHLDLFEYTRKQQVKKIVRYLKKHIPEEAHLILGGDFNDWAKKVGGVFEAELGLTEYFGPSFPSWRPILCLDRVYVRNVKVKDFSVLEDEPWNRLSDHLPLKLEFQLPSSRAHK